MDGSGTHGRGLLRRFYRRASDLRAATIRFSEPVPVAADIAAVQRAVWRQNGGWTGCLIDAMKRTAASTSEHMRR